jgi:hypothetical protein
MHLTTEVKKEIPSYRRLARLGLRRIVQAPSAFLDADAISQAPNSEVATLDGAPP